MDIKVEGHNGLVRRAGAIVNVDRDAYLEYVAKREREAGRQDQIEGLKDEISELKEIVRTLLENQNAKKPNKK